MPTRWQFIPPTDYIYTSAHFTPSAMRGSSAVAGTYASAAAVLVMRMQGSATDVRISVPLYNTIDSAGIGAPVPVISKVHFFHALSGLASAGVGAALISASVSFVETMISAGVSISAAGTSALLGATSQFTNALTSTGFTPFASGTAWGAPGGNPSAFAQVGLVPSSLSQLVQEDIFTAPVVFTGDPNDPANVSAAHRATYVPRLFPTYQMMDISAYTGVSCTWIHYGTIVEYA